MNKSIDNYDYKDLISIDSQSMNEVSDFLLNIRMEFFGEEETKSTHNYKSRGDLKEFVTYCRSLKGDFWYYREDNKIIATVAVYEILFKTYRVGYLRKFFIQKKYRNKGLGSNMLKFVEDYSKQKNWRYLMLGIDKNMKMSRKFYIDNGYKEFTKNIPSELLEDNNTWYFRKRLHTMN